MNKKMPVYEPYMHGCKPFFATEKLQPFMYTANAQHMKHYKQLTKDNVVTFLQTLLVLFLLSYSAVNGNSEATPQTAPSSLPLQQSAIVPLQQTIQVAAPVNQLGNTIKKKAQKPVY